MDKNEHYLFGYMNTSGLAYLVQIKLQSIQSLNVVIKCY